MMEEEYQLDYFRDHGLIRKICTSCANPFWTRDPGRVVCGDAPCESYTFIGHPVFDPHTVPEMREAFLSFFERHGHTRLERYPVAARWRDDIYLTIASIADFQPFVTSGLVPPPANPLTISQPCIRLNDLDSVGRSGRHLTLFEMMAHHAFNSQERVIYWKDETVAFCDEFLASIGADLTKISYKEHPWFGGGNAGPSLEVLIGGLEVATLVFMNLGREKTTETPVILDGDPYYPMKTRIVDTGYGLERFVWASQGSPTIYDAIFPTLIDSLIHEIHLEEFLSTQEYAHILALNAKYSGLVDIQGSSLLQMRKRMAYTIGVSFEDLQKVIVPFEKLYTIADHTRCLAYMLGDCIVPSNVREGYLARLVLRRTLRTMYELGIKTDLADLIEMQVKASGDQTFEQSTDVIREIVHNEVDRYRQTLQRGSRIIQKLASAYRKKNRSIPVAELITLYDSHGISPEMVRDIATQEGSEVELPDNFYSMVAGLHAQADSEREIPLEKYRDQVAGLPPTKKLYYEQTDDIEFDAGVIDFFDGYVILDQTLFYPEGGGQPADTGLLITTEGMIRVENTFQLGEVILHQTRGSVLYRGERVKGKIDEERRRSLMRHHTATHLLLRAAKDVLGTHIHQAGAQKGSESSRLDIRHYKHITPEEILRIEVLANQMVTEDSLISIKWEERTKAEQKYGFELYQGGVPPGKEIRVVRVNRDVEACAGTHCRSTGEVGVIKIIRIEHVQDGIERIEFAAGTAAIYYLQHLEGFLFEAAKAVSVQPENLPTTVQRFFTEWKEQRKEIGRLQKRIADLEIAHLETGKVGEVPVAVKTMIGTPSELVTIATGFAERGGVAVLLSGNERVHVVVASGNPKVHAVAIVQRVCQVLGGKGGGTSVLAQGSGSRIEFLDKALEEGRAAILGELNAG
ncbi:MAG: alanine--tRNA ligase [Methanomicrobiales archaeon]|nr:alanine--tRNA ligase [Methanomicrobiales archaeon]